MFVGILSHKNRATEYTTSEKFNQILALQWYDFASFKGFADFINRTKAIFSFQALVIDLREIDCDAEDIRKGIRVHRNFCSSKLVFILDSRDHCLYDCLLSENITYIIDLSRQPFESTLLDCLMGKMQSLDSHIAGNITRGIELAKQLTQPCIKLPKHPLKIGVAGCVGKAGATTLAMSIVSALDLASVKACYISQSSHYQILKEVYNYEQFENHIVINGMSLSDRQPSKRFDVFIHDYGTDHAQLESCDVKILISHSKPWELPTAANLYRSFENVHLAFNLANAEDQENIKSLWPDDTELFFLSFVENLWMQDTPQLCYWIKTLVEGL